MRRRRKLKLLPTMIAAGMIFAALIILLVVSQRVFQMLLFQPAKTWEGRKGESRIPSRTS